MAGASSNHYAKGWLLGSDKEWYHGQVTAAEAEMLLRASSDDSFLIREDRGTLFLSLIHQGEVHHVKIKYVPGGYELESGSIALYSFVELEDLVSHYQSEVISDSLKTTLGVVCKGRRTKQPGEQLSTETHKLSVHAQGLG